MDSNEEPSIERAIFKRMTTEKGKYYYEDIVRMTAEEICKRKDIPMTDDFLRGFIEASHFEYDRKKAIEEDKKNEKY